MYIQDWYKPIKIVRITGLRKSIGWAEGIEKTLWGTLILDHFELGKFCLSCECTLLSPDQFSL